MNLLYLGDITSIHDLKWISFFSQRKGYKTYFFCENEIFQTVTTEWKSKLENEGIIILPPIPNFSLLNPLKTLKAIRTFKYYIKKYNIDIIHVLFGSPQPIWFNFLPSECKKMITTRGSDVLVLLKKLAGSKGIKSKVLFNLLLSGYQKADFIVSTSTKQVESLRQYGIEDNKLRVVKTGVDVDRIRNVDITKSIISPDRKFVFSARYIGEVYNMDYQIKAIKLLSKKFLTEYLFVFVKRKTDNSEFCKNIINELKSIDDLEFKVVEDLTQEQIWATYKASDVTYMVPKSDGTPNTALECMAAEVPFIMGDLDYNKELFSNVSLVTKLADPQDFAEKLGLAVTNYPFSLIQNGLRVVKEFGDRKNEMLKLEHEYQKLNGL